MKRIPLALAAVAALALPATALAKGPSEASVNGPGLSKTITITGTEEEGSLLMTFAEGAGFFPAAYNQEPNPMLPDRPKGNLGPKYAIDYKVPGPENDSFRIHQDLYPYAKPYAVTYMAPGQPIFDFTTHGGWFESPTLKQTLVSAGLPERPTASSASVSSNSFFSTGRLGAVAAALLVVFAAAIMLRRRARRGPAT